MEAAQVERESVRLEDADGLIAKRSVGALQPIGRRGTAWRFASRGAGLRSVTLRKKRGRTAGVFAFGARARGWFDAVAANGGLTDTTLTVTIGGRCFASHLTAKSD